MTLEELESVLSRVYGDGSRPRPLHLLAALSRVRAGTSLSDAAREFGTTSARLEALVQAPDAIVHLLGNRPTGYEKKVERVRATIGQLIKLVSGQS